jgi:hypothetical protein
MAALVLSDDEQTTILSHAAPLDRRNEFIQDVAAELLKLAVVEPGNVARTCRDVQRRYFVPPLQTEQAAPRHQRRAQMRREMTSFFSSNDKAPRARMCVRGVMFWVMLAFAIALMAEVFAFIWFADWFADRMKHIPPRT